VLTFVAVTAASDIGGYAVGVLAGRHPMAPAISPKKSWEGFAGSAITSMVVGALCIALLLDGEWWVGLVLGAIIAIAATFGDLAESLIKRDVGIKDMSTLLPGHGGLMDRLDSLLASVPVVWLVLHFLLPAV
jgi:phosphatidate cytidylyltransferase